MAEQYILKKKQCTEQYILNKQQWLNNVFKETTMAEQCMF